MHIWKAGFYQITSSLTSTHRQDTKRTINSLFAFWGMIFFPRYTI